MAAMVRRRYRLFTVLAVVIVFLLFRTLQNSWSLQEDQQVLAQPAFHPEAAAPELAEHATEDRAPVADTHDTTVQSEASPEPEPDRVAQKVDDDQARKPAQQGESRDDLIESAPSDEAPLQQKPLDTSADEDEDETATDVGPDEPIPSKVHWEQPKEHYPLAKESIITLPTAKAKPMPKIQHRFDAESQADQATRLQRLSAVKKELRRSWAGYKKYAWMHDELRPVSNRSKDPFCGWAATLVDSLDTLWIAGLKDEFDEAAHAVKDINFTFTDRLQIPVFETVIRYLGGLIGAYDVSGGAAGGYGFLLDKAQELAEILIGIFDTPNRMPVLYYRWAPSFTKHRIRAAEVGMAEVATLSLEFTRLAQLTAQHKYYDAVDRITDALIQLKKDGTLLPGLFPQDLDASGCNNTAAALPVHEQQVFATEEDDKSISEPQGGSWSTISVGSFDPSRERPSAADDRLQRRADDSLSSSQQDEVDTALANSKFRPPKPKPGPQNALGQGSSSSWDEEEPRCVPQSNLAPAAFRTQKFHMGGAQDSAYEYFPKQYLLLGGREPKYQKLYEDTVDSVNKYLMFRPMVPGNWDILFPAKVSLYPGAPNNAEVEYEVTHLTCFIGGMYGLGSRLFGRAKDLEYAKKLTDGCVWAYQSTASGIMPENAAVVPCPSLDRCSFNETIWKQHLDPAHATRDDKIREWEVWVDEQERKQIWEEEQAARAAAAQAAEGVKASVEKQLSPEQQEQEPPANDNELGYFAQADLEAGRASTQFQDSAHAAAQDVAAGDGGKKLPGHREPASNVPANEKSMEKRAVIPAEGKTPPQSPTSGNADAGDKPITAADAEIRLPVLKSEPDGPDEPKNTVSPSAPANEPPTPKTSFRNQYTRPLTHQEFVAQKIEEGIPPGYSKVTSKHYILRPEAIESVWYMYRITGDPAWMDKGWTMFEATVRATRTKTANSAYSNVLGDPRTGGGYHEDSMESFWIAETLKYYTLLFAGPDVISLDEWVLNTEAHPFRL